MIDFDLRDTLRAALDEGTAASDPAATVVETSVEPDVPVALTGDERALRRSLQLILAHARQSGRVELDVFAESLSCDHSVLTFEIHDQAPKLEQQPTAVPDFGSLGANGDPDLVLWAHSTKLFAEELGVLSDPEGGNLYWFRVTVIVRHADDARPMELQR